MAKYTVSGKVVGTKYLGEFEAPSAEAAIEQALDSEATYIRLCHQCVNEVEYAEITSAEASLVDE
jgi:hypothetical protein